MTKDSITYRAAVEEIEDTLEKIEEGNMDVDELTSSVKRVTKLLKFCKDKLQKTETEVTKILGDDED
ncbi:MAG TPA: exodeoxyribonuclease VII small subunit [Bacteroidales bacterium]|nr:exodeoxyribonuclease VII small subunit [Bacteroidales bacterium]